MNGFKQLLAADLNATQNGLPVIMGTTSDNKNIVWHIASMDAGNKEYTAASIDADRELTEEYGAGKVPVMVERKRQMQLVSEHVVKAWTNTNDGEGKPIPFSAANVMALISDPELYQVYDKVLANAVVSSRFTKKSIEETAKKS